MATDTITPPSTCARCGSPDVLPQMKLRQEVDYAWGLVVSIYGKRKVEWKNPVGASSPIVARVCGACGYTELYAPNHKELWRVYQQIGK